MGLYGRRASVVFVVTFAGQVFGAGVTSVHIEPSALQYCSGGLAIPRVVCVILTLVTPWAVCATHQFASLAREVLWILSFVGVCVGLSLGLV